MTRLAKAAVVVVTAPVALIALLMAAVLATFVWALRVFVIAWEPVLDRFVNWVRGES